MILKKVKTDMGICYLACERLLGIERKVLSSIAHVGEIRITTTGPAVLARIRELHAEVAFPYNGHAMESPRSAWIELGAAIEEAKKLARHHGVNRDSEAEIAVSCTITERSVMLKQPDNLDRIPAYHSEPEINRAINKLPGCARISILNQVVWSTRCSRSHNARQVHDAQRLFVMSGQEAFEGLGRIRDEFLRLKAESGVRPNG